jgi:two-component system sensor histidine kinase KdpD
VFPGAVSRRSLRRGPWHTMIRVRGPSQPLGYAAGAGMVGAITVTALPVFGRGYPADVAMLYLLAVVVASLTLGRGPSLATALLSVAAFDFFFIPPYYTFTAWDVRHLVTFAVMLLVGIVMSDLTRRVRDQALHARERERRTAALYEMSRGLGGAVDRSELVALAAAHIARVFDGEVAVFVPGPAELEVAHRTAGGAAASAGELEAARWAFENRREAGLSTQTLPGAAGLYVPLATSHGLLGVLAVVPRDRSRFSDPEDRRFLEAFAAQMGVAVERTQLAEENAQARLDAERERLRSALLSSVSHDLRTPLGVIEGAASALLDTGAVIDEATRRDLTESIREEAQRLGTRVRDLLDMTRLEAGAVQLDVEWQSLEEVVAAALGHAERGMGETRVSVRLPRGLPLVPCDGALVEQVVVNLLENALKYSPPGSPIEVSAEEGPGEVILSVADRGPGVAPAEEDRVFQKFYQAPGHRQAGGVGLGLAICRAVAEAHRGRVWVEAREGGGAVFHLALPRGAAPSPPPEEPS